jgi:hypothetical protein
MEYIGLMALVFPLATVDGVAYATFNGNYRPGNYRLSLLSLNTTGNLCPGNTCPETLHERARLWD